MPWVARSEGVITAAYAMKQTGVAEESVTPLTYSVSADMPGGAVNVITLEEEIRASAITTNLFRAWIDGDVLCLMFDTLPLPAGDQTILDNDTSAPAGGVLGGHDSAPDSFSPTKIEGMGLSYVSATQVQVAVGICHDSKLLFDIEAKAALTADVTVSGAGGLDTGSEAGGTWYAVHLIADRSRAKSTAALLSLSETAPTLPTGYDVFRHVGWVRNDGSLNFVPFYEVGEGKERFHYIDAARGGLNPLTDGGETTMTTVGLGSYIPPTATEVRLNVRFEPEANGDTASLAHGDSTIATGDQPIQIGPGVSADNIYMNVEQDVPVNASQEILYGNSSAMNDLTLYVVGYRYSL